MDPRDAIREARLRLRKLAASTDVRLEKLREDRKHLEKQLAAVRADHAVLSADDGSAFAEAEDLLAELTERADVMDLEIHGAEQQRAEVERESKELGALAPALERAEVQRLAQSALDPALDERSAEQMALENVRHRVDALEAEASLGALHGASRAEFDSPRPKLDPKAELEALKAARRAREAGSAADVDAPASSPASKPKRTM